jgi:hypothetical protein
MLQRIRDKKPYKTLTNTFEFARIADGVQLEKKNAAMGWRDPIFCTIWPFGSYGPERIDSFRRTVTIGT